MKRRQRPRVRSGVGQTLLSNPDLVEQLKKAMLADEYRYESPEGRISGWRDAEGTYYLSEGHHRIAAALEILKESRNWAPLDRLLEFGLWQPSPPPRSHRLPTRGYWTRFLHRIGL